VEVNLLVQTTWLINYELNEDSLHFSPSLPILWVMLGHCGHFTAVRNLVEKAAAG